MSLKASSGDSPTSLARHAPGAFPASPRSRTPEPSNNPPSGAQSLSRAVKARRDEYIKKRQLTVKVGTWNVASINGTDRDLGSWFVDGLGVKGLSEDLAGLATESSPNLHAHSHLHHRIESVTDQERRSAKKQQTVPRHDVPAVPNRGQVGLYVLGLQEVVDVASATEALKPYTDPNPGKKWKQAMEIALPRGYCLIAEQQLLGLLILVYAAPEVAPLISSVSATSVGTGLMGYLGNKGAVSVRLVLGEVTKLVFVNCHLAAGSDSTALQRRIWDTNQITSRTRFTPVDDTEEDAQTLGNTIDDADHAFWFGDLNYRLDDIPPEDVRRLLLLHTRNEYDITNKSKRKIDSELGYVAASSKDPNPPPSAEVDVDPLDPNSDPTSLRTTLHSLLAHDQLRNQQKRGMAFHEGWQEGEINFLPTYKYDVGSVGMFDSGEKKRGPSWCDRILYRSRRHKIAYERSRREEKAARKKDADMKARGMEEAISDNAVLFDYDPDEDGLAYGDDNDSVVEEHHYDEAVDIHKDQDNELELDHYISHQRVLSSDHKPLDAVFTLTYDAIIPELKARLHQEVAREFDKAENEGRPQVTVVVDNYSHPEEIGSFADTSPDHSDLSSVELGEVRYGMVQSRTLTIANTGQTPATFGFIDRPVPENQQTGIAPAWLRVGLTQGSTYHDLNESLLTEYSLPPGDTATVTLAVNITGFEMVHHLNIRKDLLDDNLVLRIFNGKDHFIPVRGSWMQSSFCRTLEELVRVPRGGIRKLQERKPQVLINSQVQMVDFDSFMDLPALHSAPHELYALTEDIQNLLDRSFAEWDMVHPGETPPWQGEKTGSSWPFEANSWASNDESARSHPLELVREALDTATGFDDRLPLEMSSTLRIEVVAETLIDFLRSLRDGIIPLSSWSEIEQQLAERSKAKSALQMADIQALVMEVMSSLPAHAVSLTFITSMLIKVVNGLAPVSPAAPPTMEPARVSESSEGSEDASGPARPPAPFRQVSSPTRTLFLPSLRRRRTDTRSSTGTESSVAATDPSVGRRQEIQRAYARTFGDLLIRSDRDDHVKGKEKKTLEQRKALVLEAFLSEP